MGTRGSQAGSGYLAISQKPATSFSTMKFCSFETTDDTLLSLSGLSTLAYGAQVRPSHFCLETRNPSSLKPKPKPTPPSTAHTTS